MALQRRTDVWGRERVLAGRGRTFVKDDALFLRDQEMIKMSADGKDTYEIAERFGVSRKTVYNRLREARKNWPAAQETTDAMRARENTKLDAAEVKIWEVLNDPPYSFGSSGKVVIDPRTGEPQRDGSAVLRAVGQLVNLSRRRATLNGLDIAVESKATLKVTTGLDSEIATVVASMIAGGAGADAAQIMLEAVTGQPLPVIAGEIESGQGSDSP